MSASMKFSKMVRDLPCPRLLTQPNFFKSFRKQEKLPSMFLQWLVSSWSSNIVYLPQCLQMELRSDFQFLIRADSPAKQKKFEELKARSGGKSRFFFHGSPIEN